MFTHFNHVVFEIGVILPIKEADAVLDCLPALCWKGDSELDHIGSLSVAQFGVVSLVDVDTQILEEQLVTVSGIQVEYGGLTSIGRYTGPPRILLVMRTTGKPAVNSMPYFFL